MLAALDARLGLDLRWRGGLLDRLIDERHATLVHLVVAILTVLGWTVVVEASFNHFGDRGSIDVLAWHPVCRALLVIEVKTEVKSIEELARRLDVKSRLAADLARRERGWVPTHIATIVVLPDTTGGRSAVSRFAAVFATAWPARGREIRSWLRHPDRPLRGVWFLSGSSGGAGMSNASPPHRVRATKSVHPGA